MEHVLANATAADVVREPFPHVVIRDAVDPALFTTLVDAFPPLRVLAPGVEAGSNRRLNCEAVHALGNPDVAPVWQAFVRAHCSQAFLSAVVRVFGDAIRELHPGFAARAGALDGIRAGMRGVDTFDDHDVLLDTIIAGNSAVTARPSAVTGGHVDSPNKLFAGLLYIRHPDDDSSGGDLELHRFRGDMARFRKRLIDDRYIVPARTVRYESNVLVMFVNSIAAVHAVSCRSVTPYPRLFVNFVGEVAHDLFDVGAYQGRWTLPQRVAWSTRRVLTNLEYYLDAHA